MLPHWGEGLFLRFMSSPCDGHAKIQEWRSLWDMEPTPRQHHLSSHLSLGTEVTTSNKEGFCGDILRAHHKKELFCTEPKENPCISKVWIGFFFSSVCSELNQRTSEEKGSSLSIPKSSSPWLTQGGWKSRFPRPGAGFLDKPLISTKRHSSGPTVSKHCTSRGPKIQLSGMCQPGHAHRAVRCSGHQQALRLPSLLAHDCNSTHTGGSGNQWLPA